MKCALAFCDQNTQKGKLCFRHRPRKPLAVRKQYIRLESKKAQIARQNARDEWFEQNPPNIYGSWYCYLNGLSALCWIAIDKKEIIKHGLEHKVPKVKSRALKFDVTNLAAACPPCNKLKGSLTLDQLQAKYPDWQGPRE